MSKPGIDQLLTRSALDVDLCRRVMESPDKVFREFDLTEEEKEVLRKPDHRLLPLLGAALARQMRSYPQGEETPNAAIAPSTDAEVPVQTFARLLPDTVMALTVVPCALRENGEFKGLTYVMWANPLPEGADAASLPPPVATVFPGEPLTPLRATIRISGIHSQDSGGNPQLSMWGTFQNATGAGLPPPPESAGNVEAAPYDSPLKATAVQAAVTAVRQAASEERYDRLVDLLHALHRGDVR